MLVRLQFVSPDDLGACLRIDPALLTKRRERRQHDLVTVDFEEASQGSANIA